MSQAKLILLNHNLLRLTSLFASVILHAVVLISIPMPLGETGGGPAESNSALHITVERSQLSDTPSEHHSAQPSTVQPQAVQQTDVSALQTEDIPAQQSTEPPTSEENRLKPEPVPVQAVVAQPPIEHKPEPVPIITPEIVIGENRPAPDQAVKQSHEPITKPQTEQKANPVPAPTVAISPVPPADVKGSKASNKKPLQVATSGRTKRLSRDYRSTLLRLIERNKYYPLRARRRGMEGKAMVAFTVKQNGEIRNISLSRSSRKPLLDQAAIRTIKRMGRAPPLPKSVNRTKWKFVVPISYNIR